MLGKIEGRRRRGQQRIRWLDGITNFMSMSLGMLWGVGHGQGSLTCCDPWGHKELYTTERLNRTELGLASGTWASLVLACGHQSPRAQ